MDGNFTLKRTTLNTSTFSKQAYYDDTKCLFPKTQLPPLWVNPSIHSVRFHVHQTHFSPFQCIAGNLWVSPLLPNTDTFHSAPYSPDPPNWRLSFYGLQFSLWLASIRTPIINPCRGSIHECLPFCLTQTPSIQLHIHLTLQTDVFLTIFSTIGINKNTHHQSMPWINPSICSVWFHVHQTHFSPFQHIAGNPWASPLFPNTGTFLSAPYSPNPPNWHLSFYSLQFSLRLASIRTPIINPCHGSILPYTVYGFMFTRPTSHFPALCISGNSWA